MRLDLYEVFLTIFDEGSLSKAAQKLGVPKSTVSRQLLDLETSLNLTLIHRTTRKITPTHEGVLFAQRIRPLLRELKDVETTLTACETHAKGLIRITAPLEFDLTLFSQFHRDFKKNFPQVKIEMILTDRVVDLIGENFDLALRAGKLKDSQLVARKIASHSFSLFASPTYLKDRPPIRQWDDLEHHSYLHFQPSGVPRTWSLFDKNGKSHRLKQEPAIISTSMASLKAMILEGCGFGLIPDFLLNDELAKGQIVPVLPQFKSPPSDFFLVYPKRNFTPSYLNEYIEQIYKKLKN